MSATSFYDLSYLAMWGSWQNVVRAQLPHYARCNLYVCQSVAPEEVEAVVNELRDPIDLAGATRDVAHGARAFETSRGAVTRQWVDGNVEVGFLMRHVSRLAEMDVLDVGAGYGRLAAMLSPFVRSYVCVDPVPVSVEACRDYTGRYAPSVRVVGIHDFVSEMVTLRPTIAINVHSWNECTRRQVSRWLDALDEMLVPLLFTVTHGNGKEVYNAYEDGWPNFRHLILDRWDVIAEESIGLGSSPHVLWGRK